MLFVLRSKDDESLSKIVSKGGWQVSSVVRKGRTLEVEVDDDGESFEDEIEQAGLVILDKESEAKKDQEPKGGKKQGFSGHKSESSIRESHYESPWRTPRDPWG